MAKIIPFTKLASTKENKSILSDISVIMDEKGIPAGFAFGREAFISFLSKIDQEFENSVSDPKKAFNNPAGRMIDLIEEHLPVNPEFIKILRATKREKTYISLEELSNFLHV